MKTFKHIAKYLVVGIIAVSVILQICLFFLFWDWASSWNNDALKKLFSILLYSYPVICLGTLLAFFYFFRVASKEYRKEKGLRPAVLTLSAAIFPCILIAALPAIANYYQLGDWLEILLQNVFIPSHDNEFIHTHALQIPALDLKY